MRPMTSLSADQPFGPHVVLNTINSTNDPNINLNFPQPLQSAGDLRNVRSNPFAEVGTRVKFVRKMLSLIIVVMSTITFVCILPELTGINTNIRQNIWQHRLLFPFTFCILPTMYIVLMHIRIKGTHLPIYSKKFSIILLTYCIGCFVFLLNCIFDTMAIPCWICLNVTFSCGCCLGFTFLTRWELTSKIGRFFMAMITLLMIAIFCTIFIVLLKQRDGHGYGYGQMIIFAAPICVINFMAFLAYDLQKILKGRKRWPIASNDYMLATILFFCDFLRCIFIFAIILIVYVLSKSHFR